MNTRIPSERLQKLVDTGMARLRGNAAATGAGAAPATEAAPSAHPSDFIPGTPASDAAAPATLLAPPASTTPVGSPAVETLWQASHAKIPLEKGATAIPDRATFDLLARRDNVPGAMGVREVKFLMTDVDTATPQLYFLNTNNVVYHYDFAKGVLGQPVTLEEFNRKTYFTDARKNLAGSVLAHDQFVSPAGKQGLYTVEFWPTDGVKAPQVTQAFRALKKAMPFTDGKLAYHPAGDTQEQLYAKEKWRYWFGGVRTVSTESLYQAVKYQPLNPGTGFGVLRVVDPTQPDQRAPSLRDVVIFKSAPNDLSHVGGVITEAPQTPLSHINLKSKQNKTPNAYVKGITQDPAVQALIGKTVRFEVGPDGYSLREATPRELEAWLDQVRPKFVTKLKRDLTAKEAKPLSSLRNADWTRYGAKAANLGELSRILPQNVPPPGFALPMSFYDDFMKANGLYDEAVKMMQDPAFKADPAAREAALKAFRKKIEKAPVPATLSAKIDAVHAKFAPGQGIRCRSSTNIEDLPGFNGAGLHDSKTHRADEGKLEETVKEVWASLWTFRAFEERDFHRIDHLTAAMAVAMHPNFDDERSNGVAVTKNIYDPNWPGFYVNVQAGESLVTNPDPQATPDEFLVSAIGPRGEYETQYIRRSSLSPNGQPLLTPAQVGELTRAMERIQSHFAGVYGKRGDKAFAMDIEFKFDVGGKLVVKQARPWVD